MGSAAATAVATGISVGTGTEHQGGGQPSALRPPLEPHWLTRLARKQRSTAKPVETVIVPPPEPITGTGDARMPELIAAARGTHGAVGSSTSSLKPLRASAAGFTWDSVASDNELLLLAS